MPYEGAKTGQARNLRLKMTAPEKRLWSRLRSYRFHGLRWLRQEPFGPYIVDFYCPTARLVVELDGEAHAYSTHKDLVRQVWIEQQGAAVVRYSNSAVQNALPSVLDDLYLRCLPHLETDN